MPTPPRHAVTETTVVPGKARRMTSAMPARSTVGSAPSGPISLARSANAVAPGGRLALRSQGRAVENWLSTTASRAARCSGVRTIDPAPAGARRWETSSAPAGENTSTVAGAEAMAQRQLDPAQAGGDGVAVAPEGDAGPVVDGPGHLDGGRVGRRRQGHEHLGVGQGADGRPRWPLPVGRVSSSGST